MRNATRIWINGATGQVGQAILRALRQTDHELLATGRDLDVTALNEVSSFCDINHPDIIIHCAAYSNPEKCERNIEKAYKTNALGARNAAIAARRINAKLIQLSTDDVFAGYSGRALNEFDFATPVTVYGKSKLAGEQFVRELAPKHLIVRSSWIYGRTENNYLARFLDEAKHSPVIQVPSNRFSSPTSVDALAEFLLKLLDTKEYGIYHASCEGVCSRYEFACEIARLWNLDVKVEPVVDPRASYTLLDNLMMRMTGIHTMPHWKDALAAFAETEVGK